MSKSITLLIFILFIKVSSWETIKIAPLYWFNASSKTSILLISKLLVGSSRIISSGWFLLPIMAERCAFNNSPPDKLETIFFDKLELNPKLAAILWASFTVIFEKSIILSIIDLFLFNNDKSWFK